MKKRIAVTIVMALIAVCLATTALAATSVNLQSPSGKITSTVFVSGGALYYNIKKDGLVVINGSRLGVTVDSIDLGASVVSLSSTTPVEVNETYPWNGVKSTATNHYNEATLTISRSGSGDAAFDMIFRLFDDGVAFRYVIPGTTSRLIEDEATEWNMPPSTVVWHQRDTEMYEGVYEDSLIAGFSSNVGPPVTCELPGTGGYASGYLTISEADLYDYSGMTCQNVRGSYKLTTSFLDDATWSVDGGSNSPWRASIVVDDLNGLVNSTMIPNLAPAPDPLLENASWIQPGRALWSWWAHSDDIIGNPSRQYTYIDAAASLGFDYVLFDEGWEYWSSGTLDSLLSYAKNKGIQVWLWKKWYLVGDYSSLSSLLNFMDSKNAALGSKVLVGCKLDFMDSESVQRLDWYEMAMQTCADREYLVNFHGANKSAGEERTYPNQVTREGVRGLEYNKWSTVSAEHNAILPFTRFVAGYADYTPCCLGSNLGPTTYAHQLATVTSFTSALQHWADDPANYLASPARPYIEACPPVWDETIVLGMSEIGDLSVMARRSGDVWFLAIMNGDNQAEKEVSIDLADFLQSGNYNALLYYDNPANSRSLVSTEYVVDASDRLDIWIDGGQDTLGQYVGGGFVGLFTPTTDPKVTCASVKQVADDASVELGGKIVVKTDHPRNWIWIADLSGCFGIRVYTPNDTIAVGDIVTIQGTMASIKPDGVNVSERYVSSTTITVTASVDAPGPRLIRCHDLGGIDSGLQPGVESPRGPNNIGLIVKLAGRVTAVAEDAFYITDDSPTPTVAGQSGVKVLCPDSNVPVQAGQRVTVQGPAVGYFEAGQTTNRRAIKLLGYNDLTVFGVTGELSGSVTNAWGEDVAQAEIMVPGHDTVLTNDNGDYVIAHVVEGTYDVSAFATNYNIETENGVSITAGGSSVQDFVLNSPYGRIAGTVTDDSANPVSGVLVTLQGTDKSAVTGPQGQYCIYTVAPGTYNMTASRNGYTQGNASGVSVTADTTTAADLTVILSSGAIKGTITSPDGLPVTEATVVTTPGGYSTTTLSDGSYLISGIADGTYTVDADADGYLPDSAGGIVVTNGSYTTADIVLDYEKGTISGFVYDTSGNPISQATVETDGAGFSTTSLSDGSYTLIDVVTGTYTVTADHPIYEAESVTGVEVTPGNNIDLDFNLELSPGTLSGYVRDTLGNPVSDANIYAEPGSYATTSGPDGYYEIDGVEAGNYDVAGYKDGYFPQIYNGVVVNPDQVTQRDIELEEDPSHDVLVNGDFEGGFFNSGWGGYCANGWGFAWQSPYVSAYWDSHFVGSSRGWAQKVQGKADNFQVGICQEIRNLTPGATYTFSADSFKTTPNYSVYMAVLNGTGHSGTTLPPGTLFANTTGSWTTQSISGTVDSSGAIMVYLWCKRNYGSTADVFFDNASVISW